MDPLQLFFENEKREKVKRYAILNQFARKGQIVLAGSSLMEMFPVHEFSQGYPLKRAIYNRGIGGMTTQEYAGALDACIFDLAPAQVFLNIGSNDLNGEDFQEAEWLARYLAIVLAIQNRLPRAALYLMAYYPVNELDEFGPPQSRDWWRWRTNQRIDSANAQVAGLARQAGCRYIDANAGLRDDRQQLKKAFTMDGVHLYGNGYKVVFDALLPYFLEP